MTDKNQFESFSAEQQKAIRSLDHNIYMLFGWNEVLDLSKKSRSGKTTIARTEQTALKAIWMRCQFQGLSLDAMKAQQREHQMMLRGLTGDTRMIANQRRIISEAQKMITAYCQTTIEWLEDLR